MRIAVTALVFSVAALLALGMVMLYSTSMGQVGAHHLLTQLLWGALGLASCVGAASLDYRLLKKVAWPFFGIAVLLLALVLDAHVGTKVNGARRWLSLGPVGFQPSEIAKLALILLLAAYAERNQRHMSTWKRGIVIPGGLIALVLGLVFVEPDRGTTILLAAVSGSMLLIGGVRWLYITPPALAGVMALGLSLWHDPMRTKRIFGWLYLEEHKAGVGFQAYQAKLALGSGGWFGLGLGNGRQKLGWVPFQDTDFIFSVIGEELGLVATLLVIIAFILIVLCGVYVAFNSCDSFGLLLGSGLTLLIGFQAFINVGVVTSALPNKGLPLPFISRGGSNLLIMMTAIGIILSIARRAKAAQEISVGGSRGAQTIAAAEAQPS